MCAGAELDTGGALGPLQRTIKGPSFGAPVSRSLLLVFLFTENNNNSKKKKRNRNAIEMGWKLN